MALEDRLSSEAASAIAEAETIAISAISAWEVAMLSAKGRIRLDRAAPDWIRLALSRPGVSAVPVDPPIAVAAAGLGQAGVPADPADRMIYATSRSLGAVLVTKDQALRDFDPHGTLW